MAVVPATFLCAACSLGDALMGIPNPVLAVARTLPLIWMSSVVVSQVAQPFLLILHTCLGKQSGVRAQRQGISTVAKPNWLLCTKLMSLV